MNKEDYICEINRLLGECSTENLINVVDINKILVTLSAAQVEYLLELSTMMFCQSFKRESILAVLEKCWK